MASLTTASAASLLVLVKVWEGGVVWTIGCGIEVQSNSVTGAS